MASEVNPKGNESATSKRLSEAARELGRHGSKVAHRLYTDEQFAKWGRLGGRPRLRASDTEEARP